MARVAGRGPQRDAKDAAVQQALSQRAAEVYREILDRAPEHDMVPSIDRIAAVAQLLGDPQRAFESVHVTGTNGKSSTTRMIERLLREHGLRTGRFTSPHLQDVRERIALDGQMIDQERFIDAYEEVQPYLDLVDARNAEAGNPRLTYFEVLVAIAYAAFADTPVDVAAVEVGLGGRWDATNIIDARVAVVTPVGLDHQRMLGHDIATIATEKAGIIKPGAVAVLSEQHEEASEPLLARAAEVGATVLREGHQFGVSTREVALGGQLLTIQGAAAVYPEIFIPLHGAHQAQNAATALAAVEAFLLSDGRDWDTGDNSREGTGLDIDVVRAAFADADSPGRLEVVRRSPTVLVDAAHNPSGAQVLADSLEEAFGFSRLVGVVAVLEDKDAESILGVLEPVLDEVVITRTSSPRAMDPDELGEIAEDVFGDDRVTTFQRLDDALDYAMGRAEEGGLIGGGVLATGSVTMAADVRRLFRLT
ncbi:bifunctional folylpolyglutamate synthase/dihydrofolate synthase [Kineosporia sp. J2-2]|uniref:tetrahydrofolate synthase n=1 Tax=Kineosporia corallincola TaxID=2835133 RepID=A0ABS5TS10_9ACTN|nr:folylpolyglutamate synthase/dihydrofolate synthase family protein [Kineosporia corallincola]MBT0773575.1 bifunctional folylpolyglutamate synthase/dihydrofolate synthase [Kineosporia corallincola]